MTTTLIQSIANRQSTAADKRVEALTLYRAVLARRASPRDDDLAALSQLQIRLGKSDDDIKVDIGILQQAAQFQEAIDELETLRQEFTAANKKLAAHDKKKYRIEQELEAELNRLRGDTIPLELKLNRLRKARPADALRKLGSEHPDLFVDQQSESSG